MNPPAARGRSAEAASVMAVVAEGNCMGCGTCAAICPTHALSINLDRQRGVYRPSIQPAACTECGLCLKVCPGREVRLDQLAGQFLDAEHQHALLGRYRHLGLGAAGDSEIRYHGASGGLVTALLCHALETGMIDGALVLQHDPASPLLTQPVIARTPQEVRAAAGSKYCPAAVNTLLREVHERPGIYAVVGLPCHVHAIRKWQAIDLRMRERIGIVLGLFCANENTYLGTEYFLRIRGISPSAVHGIRYRAGGWPGVIQVESDGSSRCFPRSTSEPRAWRRVQLASAFHYDFAVPRCLVCPDQTNELADLSFADPHLADLRTQCHDGISWCVVRSAIGDRLLRSALDAGWIHMDPLPETRALRAQNYGYKAAVAGRMENWRLRGRPVPDFGRVYVPTRKMIRLAQDYRWSFHSHNRWIWPFLWLLSVCVRGPRAWYRLRRAELRRLLAKGLRRFRLMESKENTAQGGGT